MDTEKLVEDYVRKCNVLRVIDGDTIEVDVDLGYYVSQRMHIRINSFNAPEYFRGTPEERERGRKALVALDDWVNAHSLHCPSVTKYKFMLLTEKDKQTFNRYIGEIRCHFGHSVSELINLHPDLFKETKENE